MAVAANWTEGPRGEHEFIAICASLHDKPTLIAKFVEMRFFTP